MPKVNEKCGDMDTCGTKIYAYGYIAARRVLTFNVGAVIGRPQLKGRIFCIWKNSRERAANNITGFCLDRSLHHKKLKQKYSRDRVKAAREVSLAGKVVINTHKSEAGRLRR